ncbi:hypothetical protein K0M31_020486 [Melipona bicolor]|uniref:Uncharacterized protein n=1 Tax=Melipona bicolor TaxID=60889 RepID=A0AA40FQ21_9HYME|nr:hypothetical protein K0M31_020486 [Melipona bicolor]
MDFYVRPPEPLSNSGDMVQNWQKWKKDFMIFMKASNCINKPKNYQAYLLRTYIGKMGQDIIEKIVSDLKERDDMNILLAKLDKHFCHQKNEVIERYNFFNSNKKPDESIEDYIVDLKNKAKYCNFGNKTEGLIRDKIIIELKNKQLRKKLFNVENLNLSRLVSIFNEHMSTMQKNQQDVPKKTNNKIDNVSDNDIKNRNEEAGNSSRNEKSINIQNRKNCSRCNQRHPIRACPAWGLKCEKCGKYNHYTNCCPYKFTEKKEINEKTTSLNVNPQRDNEQCPTAPPMSDVAHIYPNLNYVRSQEAMNTINWSWMENRSNENLQRNVASQHPNTDQRTSNMENKPHKTSNNECRLS